LKTTITKPTTLFEFLTEQYPDSPKTRVKKLLQSGNIRCNNKVATLYSLRLKPGDIVEIDSVSGTATKAALPFQILFEDQYIVVIDKPVGIVTSSTDDTTSIQWLVTQSLKKQSRGKMRAYVVHRLDKEVSGVLLLAKNHTVMNKIKDRWRETEKHYYALVEGKPKEPDGTIESWLIEDKTQKVHSTYESAESKFAITHYKTVKQVNNYTLLDINLETGRKNQIRVHLSEIGCPIVGDRKYGASSEFTRRIRLHAYYLSFPHPISGDKIIIESPMPDGFLSLKDRNEKYK
jgi:23S rRNA pseudouridine1911/1915/1917 synthase